MQGALLCQDWPGFGRRPRALSSRRTDVPDEANVQRRGRLFLCLLLRQARPWMDQIYRESLPARIDPSTAGPPTVQGGAAETAYSPIPEGRRSPSSRMSIERGASRSRRRKMTGSQIATFRNCLGYIVKGDPIGHAVKDQFGGHFAVAFALLSRSFLAPGAPKIDDRDLVTLLDRTKRRAKLRHAWQIRRRGSASTSSSADKRSKLHFRTAPINRKG